MRYIRTIEWTIDKEEIRKFISAYRNTLITEITEEDIQEYICNLTEDELYTICDDCSITEEYDE